MQFPEFFDAVPQLHVQDPLVRVLGSAKDGILEYSFTDAVRLTGMAGQAQSASHTADQRDILIFGKPPGPASCDACTP